MMLRLKLLLILFLIYILNFYSGNLYAENDEILAANYFIANDTTELALLGSEEDGVVSYLKKLSSSNFNGGGVFIQMDSSFTDSIFGTADIDRIIIYKNAQTGKRWIREEALRTKYINVLWGGVVNDSTSAIENANKINIIMKRAFTLKSKGVFCPDGNYLFNNTSEAEIRMMPIELIGSGKGLTNFYFTDTTRAAVKAVWALNGVPFERKNFTIEGITFISPYPKTKSPADIGTGGGAGIYLANYDFTKENAYNTITIKDIELKYFKGEAIRVSEAYRINLENITGDSLNFDFLNPLGQHIRISDCYVNRTYNGCETYAKPISGLDDTTTTIFINNLNVTDSFKAFITIYTGDFVTISNCNLIGKNGITDYGIVVQPRTSYDSGGVTKLAIYNNFLSNTRYGIYFLSNSDDSPIKDFEITKNTFSNNGQNAIYANFLDSTYVRNLLIQNNHIINYNQNNACGSTGAGIRIYNCDSLSIMGNKIVNYTASTYSYGIPITLSGCHFFSIVNNDFRSHIKNSLWLLSNCNNYEIGNNLGLRIDRSYYNTDKATYHYQHYNFENNSFWINGSNIGFNFQVINNDSLVITKYNSSGTATTTTTIAR